METLKIQTIPCEIIGIDNRGNKGFSSCAAAYNSVIDRVKTKYVIYSHQDILLNDPEALEKFVSYLERTGKDDILGAAGVRFDSTEGFSNVTHIHNRTGELVHGTAKFPEGDMIECDTVDECVFGGHTEHFREHPFDEKLCNNWHLYAAESCLLTKAYLGGKVWCCDVPVFHLSSGTVAQHSFTASTEYAGNTLTTSRSSGQHAAKKKQTSFTCCRALHTNGLILWRGSFSGRLGCMMPSRRSFTRAISLKVEGSNSGFFGIIML